MILSLGQFTNSEPSAPNTAEQPRSFMTFLLLHNLDSH